MTGLQHVPVEAAWIVWVILAVILIGGVWLLWYVENRRHKIRKRLGMFCKGKG